MFNLKSLLRDPRFMISAGTLKAAYDRHDFGMILDVRTQEEYLGSHLESSINIPIDELVLKISALVPLKTTRIYCYCQTDNRSYRAVKLLKDMGYQSSWALTGGISEWQKKGFEVVK